MEINLCPRWLLVKSGLNAEAQRHLGMLLSTLLVIALVPLAIRVPHVCVFRYLLGIPCPGCGILHGIVALLSLRFEAAYHSNPAAIALGALLAFQIIARPFALVHSKARAGVTQVSRIGSGAVLFCLMTAWVFRLVSGGIHGIRILP